MQRKLVVLTGFLWLGCAASSVKSQHRRPAAMDGVNQRIARIENGFAPISLVTGEPPVKLTLQRLMQISNVPGLSVAVIENYKIAWAKGYGVTEAGGHVPVTQHTLFPAASISKPVTAMAALRLVEQGKLSLDEDVNLKLKSWKVPENEYTAEQKVTLRRILTHTAGTTVHGFPGYEPGRPVPTLAQILDGETPSNNEPVRVDFVPGTRQRYSGGGVMIEQQLMMDVTGQPFPRIMQDQVFDRLGLKDSTYEPSISASRADAVASGHNRDGEVVPGKWNFQPELAVGGLWTTPSDLATIGIELALSKQGKSNRILSPDMAREMLKLQVDPQIEALEGPRMLMGLGWELGDEAGPQRFGHTGTNVGYLAEVIMWDDGRGVVVMTNNWSFNAQCVYRYLINNIAKEYGWNFQYSPYTPWPYADTVLLATAKLKGTQAAITKYYELKKLSAEQKGKGKPTVVWASNPPDYPPNEWDLLGLGQALADPHHLADAIAIMKIETSEYPKFSNGFAALADLYARAGENKLAAQTYETLLQLTPGDSAATEALNKLKEQKQP